MSIQKNKSLPESAIQEAHAIEAPGPAAAALDNTFPQNHQDKIADLANRLRENRGLPRDDDWTDWLAAEAQAQENGSS